MPNNLKGLQMTESIYNNAGMPSEQGTAPEIPESAQVQRYRADIGGDNTVWPIVVSDAKGPLCYYRDHQKCIAARASTPPTPLVFTCPFDGEVWLFHTQEQLDMLQKHLDWHANREQNLTDKPKE
jgi:hypothetical protein